MSSAMIGAWAGAALGLLNFAVLRHVATTIENGEGTAAQKKRAAPVIRTMAFVELMLLPIIGYVVGPLMLEG